MAKRILNYHYYPGKTAAKPLLILHGLFGSAQNWRSIAQALANEMPIYCLDLRNHGESFHDNEHTIGLMAEDLLRCAHHLGLASFNLLGHSMGALVAMAVAEQIKLNKLILVDMAPRQYQINYSKEFELLQTDLSTFSSRKEIEIYAQTIVSDPLMRNFLLTNVRFHENQYNWRLHVNALLAARSQENFFYEIKSTIETPTLIVKGGRSDFITSNDLMLIQQKFSAAEIKIMSDAGHWPHFSHPQDFLKILKNFLN